MDSSDYEIITDPWDPKYVRACSMYIPGQAPPGTKALLEKIRGKRDKRIHNRTQYEEFRSINEQIVKSQGFDVDFYKLRYLFNFTPAFLDDSDSDTGRDYFDKLSKEAIEIYNKREGTRFELVKVKKANIYNYRGEIFFITFVAEDPLDHETKVFQAKVIHVFCREIVHSFCRLNPNQQVTGVEEESTAKKTLTTRKKKIKHGMYKRGCIHSDPRDGDLVLGDKQAAQPQPMSSEHHRSSTATYENRARGEEYKQRTTR